MVARFARLGTLAVLLLAVCTAVPAVGQEITSLAQARTVAADPAASMAALNEAVVPLTADDLKAALDAQLQGYQEALASDGDEAAARERLSAVLAAYGARGGDEGVSTSIQGFLDATTVSESTPIDSQQAVEFVTRAKDWALSSDGGIALGIKIALFLVVLLIAKIISNIVSGLVRKSLDKMGKGSALLRDFLANITGQVIFFVGIIFAIGQLGIDTTPVLAAIGAAGFVIGFALSDTLGNFAAGVMILLYQPYDVGDVVTAGGETGKVTAMTLVSTTLLTPDNRTIIVPNGSIWGGTITNVTGNDTRRVDMVFGCGYGDDFEKAQAILKEIVEGHELILKDPAPAVAMGALADSSVNFNVRPWTKTGDYWTVYSDIHAEVKRRFDAAGIGIPFPQMDVHVHQVNG